MITLRIENVMYDCIVLFPEQRSHMSGITVNRTQNVCDSDAGALQTVKILKRSNRMLLLVDHQVGESEIYE